ncbi:MAG: hypothetical protein AB7O62_15900 [Pirellulales bacterium]
MNQLQPANSRAARRTASRWAIWLTVLLFIILSGCSRAHYRRQADDLVNDLVRHGCYDDRYQIQDYTIKIGPQSRLFDPTCPDYSPMPPDDPMAHKLMHCVDGKKGWKGWHRNGDLEETEFFNWLDYLPTDERGRVVANLEQTVELGRVHSRSYQQNLEELYLSALDVTFERFRFDSQFYGGYATTFNSLGRLVAPATNGSNTLTATTFNSTSGSNGISHRGDTIGATRLFPGGGQLVTEFANSLVFQFSGPDRFTPSSVLHFSFTQPLLRLGGRRRVLERLTLVERSLLYNLRAMERYRQGYYVDVVTGRDSGGVGPSRRGGVTGGSGLEGFAGIGAGGFGRLTGGAGGGGAGGFGGGAGAAQAGGYLGLLQQKQEIENQRANVEELRRSYERLNDLTEAGRLEPLQTNQAAQALANATSVLLTNETQYQTTVDNFVINELGLPPDLPFVAEDDQLAQFQLLNPDLTAFERAADAHVKELTSAVDKDRRIEAGNLRAAAEALETFDEDLKTVREKLLPLVEKTVKEMRTAAKSRREELKKLAQVAERRKANIDLDERRAALDSHVQRIEDDFRKLQRVFAEEDEEADPPPFPSAGTRHEEDNWREWRETAPLEQVRDALEQHLQDTQAALTANPEDADQLALAEEIYGYVWEFIERLKAHAQEMTLAFARARLESITLPWNELDSDTALQIASDHRLDWMNAKGALVDTWRLIEFNANALQSNLQIVLDGELRNSGGPFDFRGDASTGRASLQFDAPLNRVSERNIYRQSLIEFQQARRSYMLFVDRVSQGLRAILRTMELNQLNFELRRQAVWTAIATVEQAQLRLIEPPQVGVDATLGTLGPTTARDLVSALSDLLSTQNDYLSVWVNYQVLRIQLDMDLGTMQIDERGLWVDPGEIGQPAAWCQANFEDELQELPEELQRDLRQIRPWDAEPVEPRLEPVESEGKRLGFVLDQEE